MAACEAEAARRMTDVKADNRWFVQAASRWVVQAETTECAKWTTAGVCWRWYYVIPAERVHALYRVFDKVCLSLANVAVTSCPLVAASTR